MTSFTSINRRKIYSRLQEDIERRNELQRKYYHENKEKISSRRKLLRMNKSKKDIYFDFQKELERQNDYLSYD